jgi:hypothetical protein
MRNNEKSRLIYLARLPVHLRPKVTKEEKPTIPVKNGYMKMYDLLESIEEEKEETEEKEEEKEQSASEKSRENFKKNWANKGKKDKDEEHVDPAYYDESEEKDKKKKKDEEEEDHVISWDQWDDGPSPELTPAQKKASVMKYRTKGESSVVDEALDIARAQAWLSRAYQTVIDRSQTINSIPEREAYTKLATIIQAAKPMNDAPPETVESNLQILRQQIVIGEQDSEMLRKLKNHLINSINEVLIPGQEGAASDEMGGGEPMPGGTPGGAPAPAPGGAANEPAAPPLQ